MIWTKANLIQNYRNLSNPSKIVAQQANTNILAILNSQSIWTIIRELVCEQTPMVQLIGAQILHQKTVQNFQSMQSTQRIELKNFVFQTLYNESIKHHPVINKLASACAFIACSLIENQWKQFFEDISRIYKNSYSFYTKTINAFQEIPEEWKSIKGKTFEIKNKIKQLFLQKSNILVQLFRFGFQTLSLDAKDRIKLLRCLRNWVKFGFRCLEYPDLIASALNCAEQQEKFKLVEQIVSQSIKLNSYSVRVSTSFETKPYLSKFYLESLSLILQFIQKQEVELVPYSYLIKFVTIYNAWILLQSQQIQSFVFNKMIQFLKSTNLDISYSSVGFWIELLLLSKQNTNLREIIKTQIESIFTALMSKLSTITLEHLNEEEFDAQILDDEQERYMVNVTSEQFQHQCSNLISEMYLLFDESNNELIKYIAILLQAKSNEKVLLGLYLFKSIVRNTSPTPQIQEIVNYILILQNGTPTIKIQSFKILMEVDANVINPNQMFIYVQAYFNDKQFSQYAISTFQTLVYKYSSRLTQEFFTSLITYLKQQFITISNSIDAEKICSIVFQAFNYYQSGYHYITSALFPFSVTLLQQYRTYYKQYPINPLLLMKGILQYFETIKINYPQSNVFHIQTYFNQTIFQLINILTLLKQEISYKQDNQFYYIKEIYLKCIFIVGARLDVSLSLYTLVCQLIHLNIDNLQMIPILVSTIETFSQIDPFDQKQTKNSEEFGGWVESHLSIFNKFICDTILKAYDPDLVRVFFNLQSVLLRYDTKRIEPRTFQLGCYCLAKVHQAEMLMAVMKYFYSYIYYVKDEEILFKIVSLVLNLFRIDHNLVSAVLIRALSSQQETKIVNIYLNILKSTNQECFTSNAEALVKLLTYYTMKKDQFGLVEIFAQLQIDYRDLSDILQKLYQRIIQESSFNNQTNLMYQQ